MYLEFLNATCLLINQYCKKVAAAISMYMSKRGVQLFWQCSCFPLYLSGKCVQREDLLMQS